MADLKWTPELIDTDADNAIEESGEYYLNRNVEEDNPRKMTVTADCTNPDGSVPTSEIDVNMKDVEGSDDLQILDANNRAVYYYAGTTAMPVSIKRTTEKVPMTLAFPKVESYDYVNSIYKNNYTYWCNSRLNKGYISSPFAFSYNDVSDATQGVAEQYPAYYSFDLFERSIEATLTAYFKDNKDYYVGTLNNMQVKCYTIPFFINKNNKTSFTYVSHPVYFQSIIILYINDYTKEDYENWIANNFTSIKNTITLDSATRTANYQTTLYDNGYYIMFSYNLFHNTYTYVPSFEKEYKLSIGNPNAEIELPATGNLTDIFDVDVIAEDTDTLSNVIHVDITNNAETVTLLSYDIPLKDVEEVELDTLELEYGE